MIPFLPTVVIHWASGIALACTFEDDGGWNVAFDANSLDAQPPDSPSGVEAAVLRGTDLSTHPDPCLDCYGTGFFRLTFVEPVDDVSPSLELAYRIRVVGGDASPISLTMNDEPLGSPTVYPGQITIGFPDYGENELIEFHGELTALDEAGNESEPTPFSVYSEGFPFVDCATDTGGTPDASSGSDTGRATDGGPGAGRRRGLDGCGCAASPVGGGAVPVLPGLLALLVLERCRPARSRRLVRGAR